MICRSRVVTVALAPLLLVSGLQMACSSDASPSPTSTPFDSGSVPVPEPGAQPSPITVQVQGQGTVYSADVHPEDGGFVGRLACTPASTPAQCTAPLRTTLYAIPSDGWVLAAWTTTGLGTGVDLGGGSSSYSVKASSPSPLIAVFVRAATGGPPAGPTGDAGGHS